METSGPEDIQKKGRKDEVHHNVGPALLIILIIAALGWFLLFRDSKDAKGFSGSVLEVGADSLIVEGNYVESESGDLLNLDKPVRVTILIDSETLITKDRVFLPTAAELEGTGGFYRASDLKREKAESSLEEISQVSGVGVTVETTDNIYRKKKFTALSIHYNTPVYPEETR